MTDPNWEQFKRDAETYRKQEEANQLAEIQRLADIENKKRDEENKSS